jgi:hypothetical protein
VVLWVRAENGGLLQMADPNAWLQMLLNSIVIVRVIFSLWYLQGLLPCFCPSAHGFQVENACLEALGSP